MADSFSTVAAALAERGWVFTKAHEEIGGFKLSNPKELEYKAAKRGLTHPEVA
jgi:hypothetical protein